VLSADGRYVSFRTDATNLVPNDNNHESDVVTRFVSTPEPSGVTPGGVARGANASTSPSRAWASIPRSK